MQELEDNHKGKLDYEIKDWSKIKYMVRYHCGVHVDNRYPNPVVQDCYFEEFSEMEKFVSWYEVVNQSVNKKIIFIMETGRFFNIERYEVATKVRLT